MNGFVGSSFYDTINKLMIGFLLLLPFLPIVRWNNVFLITHLTNSLRVPTLVILCWIIGLFFWAFMTYIMLPFLRNKWRCFAKYFSDNDIDLINDACNMVQAQIGQPYHNVTLTLPEYLAAYYVVTHNGLIGNVGRLESFSAFFRNFFFILIWWIFFLGLYIGVRYLWRNGSNVQWTYFINFDCVNVKCGSLQAVITIVICIVLCVMCVVYRQRTERQIHYAILEAYFLFKPSN